MGVEGVGELVGGPVGGVDAGGDQCVADGADVAVGQAVAQRGAAVAVAGELVGEALDGEGSRRA
ncbi:MAG: hypothetical protein CK429_34450 [Mycobacterium sp.]|nr:MAG: hypothetical protein CK429_34450 [Mycobacterium sp.]PJE10714.1 MAG: hypothetical protein CK428_16215 [Mycobacterium sp.]PJE25365.1 MAG: hypothetical protein CK431_01410 [Mycobacterium sp.]